MSDNIPLANFERAADDVWCGARPDTAGAAWLVAQGVKTVVNLEWEEGDIFPFSTFPDVRLVRLPDIEALVLIDSWEDRHVQQVIDELRYCTKPVYVHCRAGQNRTRVAIGAYQLIVLKLPLETVLTDLSAHGGLWQTAIAHYLTNLAQEKST